MTSVGSGDPFGTYVLSRQTYAHQNTSLPVQLFFKPRSLFVDFDHVWMLLIKDNINQLSGETPSDSRMGVPPAPVSSLLG
jgi:hypothetical protein